MFFFFFFPVGFFTSCSVSSFRIVVKTICYKLQLLLGSSILLDKQKYFCVVIIFRGVYLISSGTLVQVNQGVFSIGWEGNRFTECFITWFSLLVEYLGLLITYISPWLTPVGGHCGDLKATQLINSMLETNHPVSRSITLGNSHPFLSNRTAVISI